MKKRTSMILAIILALGGFSFGFYIGFSQNIYVASMQKKLLSQLSTETKELHLKSFETSKIFAKANILTQMVLSPDTSEVDYKTWKKDLDYVIDMWEEVGSQSQEMEKSAEYVAELYRKIDFDLFSIPTAEAATKFDAKKINAIYDAAPAGKKIRTLAKQLNVDAKRAYKMLKMAQNQVTAEAWNDAGDTFETLENTARAIKDVSKVTVYAGGAALSGGAVSTVGTILSEGGAIIGGVDLLFEVGEDVSAIAFGYNDKSVAMLGDLRKITEPAASIIGLANITNATNSFDRWSAVLFGADQINSAVQENKYLGIKVNFDDMVIESEGMDKEKMKKWMEKEKIEEEPSEDLVGEVLDFSETEEAMMEYFVEPEIYQDLENEVSDIAPEVVERDNETFDADSDRKEGYLTGTWEVVGVNSKDDIPDFFKGWVNLKFHEDNCDFLLASGEKYSATQKYSFDDNLGTGEIVAGGKFGVTHTLEYGDDHDHLFVRLSYVYGPTEYFYLKKIN